MKNIKQNIHKELLSIFKQIDAPSGKGYYIGTGDEPVFIVYLPYENDVSGRAEDKIAQVTHRLKVDIIARNGASFTDIEEQVMDTLEQNGFEYKNGENEVDTKEPYNYHSVLYFNKKYYKNELAPEL